MSTFGSTTRISVKTDSSERRDRANTADHVAPALLYSSIHSSSESGLVSELAIDHGPIITRPATAASPAVTTFETWFGPVDAPLFGSVHMPASGVVRGAVVLCSPLGKEHVNTYRGMRQLSAQLAEQGLLALRFDYHGHGDSFGDQDDADAVQQWISSVREAVSYVRQAGAEWVSIVGLRVGALIAARAAADLGPLTSLVLWDPVLSGRRYLREQTAFYRMTVGDDSSEDSRVSILGAILHESAADDLGKIKIDPLDVAALSIPTLCVVRDENTNDKPITTLVSTGADLLTAHRHHAFVNPPSFIFSTPTSTIESISNWLAQHFGSTPVSVRPARRLTAKMGLTTTGDGVFESIEYLGADSLLSIRSHAGTSKDQDAVVVLHSTASEHRIGPARLWVETARRLSAQGLDTVRFDRRGTGDSGVVAADESTPVMSKAARADVDSVVATLGADSSHTMHVGMCSGSWHSAYAARKYGAAAVVVLNTVNWSFRRRRTPLKAATVAAMESRTADRAFKAARVVRNAVRGAQAALPYGVWRMLGSAGLVAAPESMLAPLVAAGTRTVVMLSPSDHEWFVASRGERGLSRIRAKGADVDVSIFDRGDHSLYHRDLREAMSGKIMEAAVDVFDLDLALSIPIVAIGVEKI